MTFDIFETLNMSVDDLDLSVRSYNCLRRANFDTVFDILRNGPVPLMKVRNLGRKCHGEILDKLSDIGFSTEFRLLAASICAVASARLESVVLTDVSKFLEDTLGELGCDTDSVKEAYMEYGRKKRDLRLEERLLQFVLIYYYEHKTPKSPDLSDTMDEADIEYDPADIKALVAPDETQVIEVQPTALATLERMTGLQRVKEMISDISAHCLIAKMKQEAGGIEEIFIPNALFLGNPGSGKTTVAKIIAQLYKEIGLLEQGHLVVTEQSGLIGKYVGHTAPLVKEIFESALGGVLFIDEAYMLGENNDFGKQAVATLTNMMTEHKGQCCVILAGYEERMNRMMSVTNPGLRERFPFKLIFDDYNADELMEIFMGKLENGKLRISPEGRNIVFNTICKMYENRTDEFANAREAENLFQEIVLQQERRLFLSREKGSALSPKMLFSLTKADCEPVYARIMAASNRQVQQKRLIGFAS